MLELEQQEEEKANLAGSEKDILINQLKDKLKDASQKAEQGSMQLQGEAQELVIEEWLASEFPLDTIEEIKSLRGMIQQPPFPGQSNYSELKDVVDNKLASVTREVGSPPAVVERRKDVVNSGLADWKIYFELAVLNQRLRNPPAMYYHLNQIFELYPHNRESYMKIAEAMSKDGRWREVIPYLEQSLYYTRGDERKIAETIGWLGTTYFKTGEYEKATDLLLAVTEEYSDQTGLTLRAYGNLIKYSREKGRVKDLDRYIEDVQRYARSLIRQGKDKEYPLLYKRMSQFMTMGGYTAEAKEWAQAQGQ